MATATWTYNADDQESQTTAITVSSDSTVPLDVRRFMYHTVTAHASGVSATDIDIYMGNNTSTGLVFVASATLASGANTYMLGTSGGSIGTNCAGRPLVFNWLKLKKRGGGKVYLTHGGK